MRNLLQLLLRNRGRAPALVERPKAAADGVTTLYLYDSIVSSEIEASWWGGVAAAKMVRDIAAVGAGTIVLRVNSPGGDVFAGQAIAQAMRDARARGVRVEAHVDGYAASAATVVSIAADEVVMAEGAMWMIHQAWTIAMGNAEDMLGAAALLEKVDGSIAEQYAKRTGKDKEYMSELMAAETWFTAAEAVDAGFADRVDEGPAVEAAWDLSVYGKAPKVDAPEPAPAEPAAPAKNFDHERRLAVQRAKELALY
jgi:ATP-dependent Clp protease, protease subunit